VESALLAHLALQVAQERTVDPMVAEDLADLVLQLELVHLPEPAKLAKRIATESLAETTDVEEPAEVVLPVPLAVPLELA